MIKYIVTKSEENQTLEKYIKRKLEFAPLSFIYKLFRKKDIKVNGKRVDSKYKVCQNDEVLVYISDEQHSDFKKGTISARDNEVKNWIVYEDDNIIVINKPAGLLVQKNTSNAKALDDMVISYYLFKHPEVKEDDFLPAPCHRIDRNTSGLVIFGKNIETVQELLRIFKEHKEIEKRYYALVEGNVKSDGVINAPIVKNEEKGISSVSFIDPRRKEAISEYYLLENYGNTSLVDVKIITGRTHQIRVHMAYKGHPLVGDGKYGNFSFNKMMEKQYGIKDQFLQAYQIKFYIKDGKLKYLNNVKLKCELSVQNKKILQKLKEDDK